VADFPLSRSKEEAIQWFEGSPAFRDMHSTAHLNNNSNEKDGSTKKNSSSKAISGGGLKGSSKKAEEQENSTTNNNKNKNEKQTDEPEETHSSYGTTQVNVLTVREVPVMSPDEAQRSQMADPFGGFGNIAPAGMLNPFGSLFGGFFGAGGGGPSSSMPNMMSGSRSVSSSTRMTRDDNGKRVATTVTKTTTVDGEGKKRVETETTVRHLDEGGRVETNKVVQVDGGEDASSSASSPTTNAAGAKPNEKRRHTARSLSPRGFADEDNMPSPFNQSQLNEVIDPSAPPSPPEVAEIATNLRLGLAVTDGTSSDPDNPNQVARKSSGSGGWRKTEYLFRLGRFVPPFMVVSQYYEDKVEEERRRKELTKEYNERRQRQKENKWGKKFSERQQQEKDAKDGSGEDGNTSESEGTSNNFPIPADFPIDTSRVEYYLQRLHTQMEKNAAMMEIMVKQIFKPDFPQKVRHSGERILENMGPTAERTGKLMKDVWTMWVESFYNGDDDRGGGGRR